MSRATSRAAGGEGSALLAPPRQPAPRYRVPAAARTLALLELLAEAEAPIGVSEIARRLGMPKSSAFTLLSTLDELGYARRNADDEWLLTLRLYKLGLSAARSIDILNVARPIVEDLSAATGMTAHLGMFDGRAIVYALKVEPAASMIKFDTYPGKVASVHLTAIGRAVASILDARDLAILLDRHEFRGGDNPRLNDRAGFDEEVALVRERGFALEFEEENVGVACLAAPVAYADGNGAAAVGVTGLAAQIEEASIESLSALVTRAAASLALSLGSGATDGQR